MQKYKIVSYSNEEDRKVFSSNGNAFRRLNTVYEKVICDKNILSIALKQIRTEFGKEYSPSCFISYAWSEDGKSNDEDIVEKIAAYLSMAGVNVHFDKKDNNLVGSQVTQFTERIQSSDFIIVFGSNILLEKYYKEGHVIRQELSQISVKHRAQKISDPRVLPVIIGKNNMKAVFPPFLADTVPEFLNKDTIYESVFNLLKRIYRILITNPKFIRIKRDFGIRSELLVDPIGVLQKLEENQHNPYTRLRLIKNMNFLLDTRLFTLKPRPFIQIASFLLRFYTEKESWESLESNELHIETKRFIMSVLARLSGEFVDQAKIQEIRTLSKELENSRALESHYLSHYCIEGTKWICHEETSLSSWVPNFLNQYLIFDNLFGDKKRESWYLPTSVWLKTLNELTFINWINEFKEENWNKTHPWIWPYAALDIIDTRASNGSFDSITQLKTFFRNISNNMGCPEANNFRIKAGDDFDWRLFYKFYDVFLNLGVSNSKPELMNLKAKIQRLSNNTVSSGEYYNIRFPTLIVLAERYQLAVRS